MKKMSVKLAAFSMVIFMFLTLAAVGCGTGEVTETPATEALATEASVAEETSEEPEEKPTIVLSRWAGPHADDQKIVLAEYPDAIARVDDIDYMNLKQKQILSMTSSADYDLVWASEIWLAEYISNDWFLALDDYVDDFGVDLSVYSQAMVDMNRGSDGKLYALPTFAQSFILTYNTEWLESEGQEVPTTPEELLEVAKYFKENGTGIAIPALQGQAAADLFAQILFSAGGDYFDSSGKLNLLSDEALYAANYWDELTKYSITGSLTWHHDQVSQALREEGAPLGITISGESGLDSDPEMSRIVDKVGYTTLPGKEKVAGCVSYWSWGVAANSKNPEAAFKLAVWLTSTEIEKKQTLMNGQISAIPALAEDSEVVAQVPFLPAISATLENAKTQPTSVSAARIFEPLQAALSEIASTDNPPEEVMQRLQEQLKDVTIE